MLLSDDIRRHHLTSYWKIPDRYLDGQYTAVSNHYTSSFGRRSVLDGYQKLTTKIFGFLPLSSSFPLSQIFLGSLSNSSIIAQYPVLILVIFSCPLHMLRRFSPPLH
ncbi:hypothetical protein CHS0354_041276 [Potamilus streckersoni]|uniref:Uncharacterized protein n=1 Tax=Potamilus streckersoni TaxID=2493646 RepID=A0AAE0SF81_9BIVA|nr:hypothetical protein CHS0354_041276 [Potamilus streckersoni]